MMDTQCISQINRKCYLGLKMLFRIYHFYLFTHHSQRSSDKTVPMKPLINSKVHTRLVGGSSNCSMRNKCHNATNGNITTASISPTNPSDNKYIHKYSIYTIILTKEHWYL